MSKNLVIATIGDNSLHKKWLEGIIKPNHDLYFIYYGNEINKYSKDCEYYSESKGYKYPLIYKFLTKEIIDEYDYFFLPDDDISMNRCDINLLFKQMEENKYYYIAQPSLEKECPHTWPHTTTRYNNISRFTTFVEIMCPIFRKKSLIEFLPYFTETHTGWGLDLLWSRKSLIQHERLGIFDNIVVSHTRKMGEGTLYSQLKKDGINYKQEYADFLKKYNLTHTSQKDKKYYVW